MTEPREPAVPSSLPGYEARPWYADRWLLGLVLAATVLGVIYNGVMLLGFGPDEQRHMNYVRLLLEQQRLPLLVTAPDGTRAEYAGAHTLHPPLYYLLLVPLYAVARGLSGEVEWHLLRLVSLALCLAALPWIYQIAQRAGRRDQNLARLAVAHIALLPLVGMIGGVINNDSATFFAVTLFLWLLVVKYPHERSVKSALVLGLVFGLGAACKATAVLCDGAALLLYLAAQDGKLAWRSSRNWSRLGVVLLLAALIAGPWYARNLNLYGQLTPVEAGYTNPALPRPEQGMLVMMLHDNFPLLLAFANWGLFYSLWSQKDWIPESLRLPIYGALAGYSLLAVGGIMRAKRHSRAASPAVMESAGQDEKTIIDIEERIALWTVYGALLINWLACVFMALFKHWGWAEGGRYLLPSLMGLGIFLARGWRGLLGSGRLPALTLVWSLAFLALNGVAIYWLVNYLNPTFGLRQ